MRERIFLLNTGKDGLLGDLLEPWLKAGWLVERSSRRGTYFVLCRISTRVAVA